jgi:hypothetical protein
MKGLLVIVLAVLALSPCPRAFAQKPEEIAGRPALRGDWKFPSPKVKERRDPETKRTLYDLGHGFFASRVRIEGNDLVIVGIPQDADTLKAPDSELAFMTAQASLKLCVDFGKLFLEPDGNEFRFRTLNGDTAGVTIAHDRKTAVVRVVPVEMQ